jgi:hypothetical protein
MIGSGIGGVAAVVANLAIVAAIAVAIAAAVGL